MTIGKEDSIHAVCQWLGNSQLVAAKHYLQVTDGHFEQAVQNPAQQPAVKGGNTMQDKGDIEPENAVGGELRRISKSFNGNDLEQVGDTGLEPVTFRV